MKRHFQTLGMNLPGLQRKKRGQDSETKNLNLSCPSLGGSVYGTESGCELNWERVYYRRQSWLCLPHPDKVSICYQHTFLNSEWDGVRISRAPESQERGLCILEMEAKWCCGNSYNLSHPVSQTVSMLFSLIWFYAPRDQKQVSYFVYFLWALIQSLCSTFQFVPLALIRWTTFLFSVHCYIVLPRNRKKVDSKSVLRILGVWWLMFGWCFLLAEWFTPFLLEAPMETENEWAWGKRESEWSEKEAGVPGYVLGAKCATCLSRIRYREKKMAVLIHGGSKAAMRPLQSHIFPASLSTVFTQSSFGSQSWTDGTGKVSFWTKMSMCKMYWWKYITICILSTCIQGFTFFFKRDCAQIRVHINYI